MCLECKTVETQQDLWFSSISLRVSQAESWDGQNAALRSAVALHSMHIHLTNCSIVTQLVDE